MKARLLLVLILLMTLGVIPAYAAPNLESGPTINFDSYTLGNINGQVGWSKTGAYDVAVVANSNAPADFGTQSLRISNGVATGSFGDQTFAKPLTDEAAETNAYPPTASGTRQKYFTTQWDFTSAAPDEYQPDLSITVSPDNGTGGRMSWVQMQDTPTGLQVNFYDYRDRAPFGTIGNPADGREGGNNEFSYSVLATGLNRTAKHTIKIELELLDGPRNDVVRVYVDGTLKHTGTSWEDYYRWEQGTPASGYQSIPVRTMLFRAGGTAAPNTLGKGFLIDNLSMTSGALPAGIHPSVPVFCTGETAALDISFANVTNLYGYQFKVHYDPAVATATGGFVNNWFDTTVDATSVPDWAGTCSAGVCQFAVTKQSPATGVNGSGTVARITFTGSAMAADSPVTFSDVILSDVDGNPIAQTLDNTNLNVCGFTTANGKIALQGRATPKDTGTVTLTDPTGLFGSYTAIFSAADGAYTLPNIKVMPTTGSAYQVDATHGLYLGKVMTPTLTTATQTLNTTLKGGDANNDGRIDINDMSCIATAFGSGAVACGATGSTDINKDTFTNILDLVLAGGNFGSHSPQTW